MSTPAEILPDGTFILNRPVKLPEVSDILIIGGGPAGTAAAFRAKELGLAALVIDFDDLMKRIRDYAKDKLILPDYGGGDKMQFPQGDKLISLLHFSPIDKDDMCKLWKGFYRENNVPAQIGIELLGLQRRRDGVWQARAYNHNTKAEQAYLAKHIVIGIGRGVPRRFDIPGNAEGIAYRLSDANLYTGASALVIGGGTSAAEAVIAISNAKIKANDSHAVYWSYRGDKLPKVSKALAEVFFDAYLGNGNIRHYPYSEPVAVVTAEDRKEYLSLRTDRRAIPGRPRETSHLEFLKEHCIACIGEDIPEAFLNSLGIAMVTGGPSNKKRMVVTPLLETQQPNVYFIGDILSQAYLETEDFNADPATFREIKHRGNIKAALIDGVLVAETIAQKLAGKKDIQVEIKFKDEREKPETKATKKEQTLIAKLTSIAESEGAPEKSFDFGRLVEEHEACLVRLLAGNVEENEFPVRRNGITTIGRNGCDVNFPEDTMLSEKHASISHNPGEGGYFLRDDGSATGVFLKVKEAQPLEVFHGNIVRLGKQFLVFRVENGINNVIHFDNIGKQINRYQLPNKTIVLGREAPDIVLDGKDRTLSRRHLSIAVKENKILIKDLGSANGSFIKVKDTVRLEPGDQFRVGQQSLKFSLKEETAKRTAFFRTAPPQPVVPPPAKREDREATKPEGMVVVFKNLGKSCPFKPGQTICEIAEKNGLKIKADCHIGSCGIDPIRILSGIENMNEIGDQEQGTLEDINSLKPGEYRLACVAKPKGPVVVEILEQ
jgi:pSer/pThr/pTyr-binding forkhead associated (FHA) protein/thioredoxin reductase/ferredoxin